MPTECRHDPHAHGDVGRIRKLHPDLRERRSDRPHAERHDVQRASTHAAFEELQQPLLHLRRIDPVVGRSRVTLLCAANEGAIFDARDITGIRARKIAAGTLRVVERDQRACAHQPGAQVLIFSIRTIAPDDPIGTGEPRDLGNPTFEPCVARGRTDAGGRCTLRRVLLCVHSHIPPNSPANHGSTCK
jgi:hypothetical protein